MNHAAIHIAVLATGLVLGSPLIGAKPEKACSELRIYLADAKGVDLVDARLVLQVTRIESLGLAPNNNPKARRLAILFAPADAEVFAKTTEANVGKVIIGILDGKRISEARILEAITDGVYTLKVDIESARALYARLKGLVKPPDEKM